MTFDLIEKMNKNFPPLDISHATAEEILHLRMVGLSIEDEKKALARAKELGMLHHADHASVRKTDNTD